MIDPDDVLAEEDVVGVENADEDRVDTVLPPAVDGVAAVVSVSATERLDAASPFSTAGVWGEGLVDDVNEVLRRFVACRMLPETDLGGGFFARRP